MDTGSCAEWGPVIVSVGNDAQSNGDGSSGLLDIRRHTRLVSESLCAVHISMGVGGERKWCVHDCENNAPQLLTILRIKKY